VCRARANSMSCEAVPDGSESLQGDLSPLGAGADTASNTMQV
jgi:hypothetical protein